MAKVSREQKKLLKTIKKRPHDSVPLVQLGWMLINQHENQEARDRFTRAVELNSDPNATAEARYGLALLDHQGGRHEEAKGLLIKVIQECPNFPKRAEVHFVLAQTNEALWRATDWKNEKARQHNELFQRSIDHYEQAIERRSEHLAAANFYLGKLYYDVRSYDEALPLLQRAVTIGTNLSNPQVFEINYLLGTFFREIRHDADTSQEYLTAALKKGGKPELLADVYRQLGVIAQARDDDEHAVEYYEKALAQYGDTQTDTVLEVLLALGELKYQHHWFEMALEYGERAVSIETSSDTLQKRRHRMLAEAYYGNRDYAKAEEHLQHYLPLCRENQERAEGFLRLGTVYEHLEQRSNAADAYRKGLKIAGRNQLVSQLNAALGRVYMQEERLNQAAKHLKDAIEFAADEDGHTPSVYCDLGACQLKREELEKAIELFGTVIAKFPDSPEEPRARETLKNLRKQCKKESQSKERMDAENERMQEKLDQEVEELERLQELIDEILDEKGFFQRLKEGLAKTHFSLVAKIEDLLASRSNVDDEFLEDLEEILILSDLGVATTQRIITNLQECVQRKELEDPSHVKYHLKREVQAILQGREKTLDIDREQPFIILVIGVNGTGKTTSIGKMASKFKALGKDVMLVAGDTFRAAAIEQLEIWGERTDCEVIKHASGADPSAVMYDAIHAAKSRNVDVVIADTAGRLHTKKNLMEELKKMVRIISRELSGAPHEILMVVDATTGQNAVSQAQLFHEGVGLSGLILTKLDGTAKGGIIVSIAHDLDIPVAYIGIGEQVEDLREFHAKEFVDALFED